LSIEENKAIITEEQHQNHESSREEREERKRTRQNFKSEVCLCPENFQIHSLEMEFEILFFQLTKIPFKILKF